MDTKVKLGITEWSLPVDGLTTVTATAPPVPVETRTALVVAGGHGAGEGAEAAADLAEHHVAHREGHLGVGRVDLPRAGDVPGDLGGGVQFGHGSSSGE